MLRRERLELRGGGGKLALLLVQIHRMLESAAFGDVLQPLRELAALRRQPRDLAELLGEADELFPLLPSIEDVEREIGGLARPGIRGPACDDLGEPARRLFVLPVRVEEVRALVADGDLVLRALRHRQVTIAGDGELALDLGERPGRRGRHLRRHVRLALRPALVHARVVGELGASELALRLRVDLLQREDCVVSGLARELAFGIRLRHLAVLLGGRFPLLQRPENFGVVEAQPRRRLGLRIRLEILAVHVARDPVGRGALRLDGLLVVVLHQIAQRALSQLSCLRERALLFRVRLRPSARRRILLREALRLGEDVLLVVELVVREDDALLPGRRAWMRWRLRLERPVDVDGAVELALVEEDGGEPLDERDAVVPALRQKVAARLFDVPLPRVGEDEVLQRFAPQLHPVAGQRPVGVGVSNDVVELCDGSCIIARVVIAPGELVGRERVDFRQLERSRLGEGVARVL